MRRVPGAVQREAVHRRTGTAKDTGVCGGPGSAAHHCVLRRARDTDCASAAAAAA
jgi:hypothetical protein